MIGKDVSFCLCCRKPWFPAHNAYDVHRDSRTFWNAVDLAAVLGSEWRRVARPLSTKLWLSFCSWNKKNKKPAVLVAVTVQYFTTESFYSFASSAVSWFTTLLASWSHLENYFLDILYPSIMTNEITVLTLEIQGGGSNPIYLFEL